jgi:hypothetical protein
MRKALMTALNTAALLTVPAWLSPRRPRRRRHHLLGQPPWPRHRRRLLRSRAWVWPSSRVRRHRPQPRGQRQDHRDLDSGSAFLESLAIYGLVINQILLFANPTWLRLPQHLWKGGRNAASFFKDATCKSFT